MGYRSEVSLVVTREVFATLLARIPTEFREMIRYADSVTKRNDAIRLHWTYIKWYTEYGEIGALTRTLNNHIEYDDYYLIRVGEDRDDMEEQGGYYDNPFDTCIVRLINIGAAGEPLNLETFQ